MVRLKDLGSKGWLIAIIGTILITDITIFLNLPVLRQILAFICFSIIPGLLILYILKLNEIDFFKKFLLSVGLSVSFFIFAGLLINELYPTIGFQKPLLTASLVVSFSVILTILAFIAYRRNKDDFDIRDVFNFQLDLKDKLTSPLIFPIIFPFLAVFGTYLMNTQGNNVILLALLFLIPAYIVSIVFLKDRIPKITYPIAISMISIALLFVHGLTSYYINGRDVYGEYSAFQATANNLHWSMSNYPSVLTACLSTSLLPTVYKQLLNINGVYVYKLIYPTLFSITPLAVYVLSKKYIKEQYAFFAALYFMFQLPFIDESQSMMRQLIAMIFFALAIVVLFDDEVDKFKKTLLLIIFTFGIVVSHYTTAYIFFILEFSILLARQIKKFKTNITPIMVTLFFALIFFWYSQVTESSFNDVVRVIENTFINLINFFDVEARDESVLIVLGGGIRTIPEMIEIYTYDVTFAFIGIGVLYSAIKCRNEFDDEYLAMMLASLTVLGLFVMLPYINHQYGNARLFIQLAVLLSLAFVIGGKFIGKRFRLKHAALILIPLLILQLFNVTFVTDQAFGVPKSMDLNREGDRYNEFYIHDQEVAAARWLVKHNEDSVNIYSDDFGVKRVYWGYLDDRKARGITIKLSETKKVNHGYIYLRYENVINKKFYFRRYGEKVGERSRIISKYLKEFSYLFNKAEKIYDNAYSEIYYFI